MSNILIGSSNVFRFYRREVYKEFKDYNVVRCTDINNFDATMTSLEPEDKEVVISVIENFLEKSARNEESDEGFLTKLGETVDLYVRIITEAATRLPGTRFAVADPIMRPKIEWYQKNFECIQLTIKECFRRARKDNIMQVEGIPEGCQQFEGDQVHLTPEAGQIFIEGLLKESEKFFKAPIVDLGEEEDQDMPQSIAEKLEKRIRLLEDQVEDRRKRDNSVFARMREEMDFNSNKLKEDRIVITGIMSKIPPPTDPAGKKAWITKIVEDICKAVIPDFTGKIIFINQMKNNNLHVPLVEVKFDSTANAAMMRKIFAEKKKSGADLGRIFIANCVNLATRVRVDIMKALARKITDNSNSAYVVPFISKPIIHVRPTGTGYGEGSKSYNFVEAVEKFGHLVKQVDLGDAYRRAGNSFKGQLEQHFIILREKFTGGTPGPQTQHQQQQQQQQHQQQHKQQRQNQRGSAKNVYGAGRKRTREEDETETESAGTSYGYKGQKGSKRGTWRGK